MDQLLQIANDSGMSDEQSKQSLGGLLSYLKSKLDELDWSKLSEALGTEQSSALIEESEKVKAEAKPSGAGSSLMDNAMGLMNSLTGEGGGSSSDGADGDGGSKIDSIPELLSFLNGLGVNQKQVTDFLPNAVAYLKTEFGVDASPLLGLAGGTGGGTADNDASGGGGGGGGSLAEQASNFFNSLSGGKKDDDDGTNEGTGGLVEQASSFLNSLNVGGGGKGDDDGGGADGGGGVGGLADQATNFLNSLGGGGGGGEDAAEGASGDGESGGLQQQATNFLHSFTGKK